MSLEEQVHFDRRAFLARISALSAACALALPRTARAEPSPEVRKIRLQETPAICLAPQFIAEELLRGEGFQEIEYVKIDMTGPNAMAAGRVDLSMWDFPGVMPVLDEGKPVVA